MKKLNGTKVFVFYKDSIVDKIEKNKYTCQFEIKLNC